MNEPYGRSPGAGYQVPGSRRSRRLRLVVLAPLLLMAAVIVGCGGETSAQPPQTSAVAASVAPSGHAATPHGDHAPHHGGAVLMHRDLHYEVVLPAVGGAQLYLTDAVRQELPASVVSSVVVEIDRPGIAAEQIELAMDPGGDFWSGDGRPISGAGTVVRIGFAYDNETISVELPYETYFGTRPSDRAATAEAR